MKFSMPIASERIKVNVVGAGGTGSALLAGLVQLCIALRSLGHPGLRVVVWDPDTVSQANIGRQIFAPSDVGQYKACVLVNRINLSYGLDWECCPERYDDYGPSAHGIVIGCVDSRRARADIYRVFSGATDLVWLDCGNNQYSGQVLFGARRGRETVVPSVADLFPEVVDVAADATDDKPSCSLAEALTKQDLMVNRFMADTAVNLLYQLIRKGEVEVQGAFIDVANFSMMPVRLDPKYWASMGWSQRETVAA